MARQAMVKMKAGAAFQSLKKMVGEGKGRAVIVLVAHPLSEPSGEKIVGEAAVVSMACGDHDVIMRSLTVVADAVMQNVLKEKLTRLASRMASCQCQRHAEAAAKAKGKGVRRGRRR
jgi:hypothetical protein